MRCSTKDIFRFCRCTLHRKSLATGPSHVGWVVLVRWGACVANEEDLFLFGPDKWNKP